MTTTDLSTEPEFMAEAGVTEADLSAEPIGKPKARRKLDISDEHIDGALGPVRAPGTALYSVPADDSFGPGDYQDDIALRTLAFKVLDANPAFAPLKMLDIRYYWQRKGGSRAGRPSLGRTLRPSGLLRHETSADFIVLLAADHCQGFTRHQVEALLFRRLCEMGRDEDGNRTINHPDFVGFTAEIRAYGLWVPEFREAAKVIRQLTLDEVAG